MKKEPPGSIRRTITKVALSDINEQITPFTDQMTPIDVGYTEEHLDADGSLVYVKEVPKAKLRNFLAHADLLERFNALRPHMALYAEYAPDQGYETQEELMESVDYESVYVTEVMLTGSNEKSGVVLSGFKLLADENRIKLVTPNINLDLSEYAYVQQLSDSLDELVEEARLAIIQNKCKIVQQELFGEDVTEVSITLKTPGEAAPAE